ncbi:hypothetical protein [Agrococcus sp. KRD186]|uniref:hypothetical protein n=1 Tax=Agrococcus sp. KRD186 TaxID=2729730 RepID=UPI0019D1EBD2|nr:hypothetical protein [Agrococcus sp. KRD186]
MHALFMEELPYDPNQVTPGVIGFAVTALVAVAVMLLMWDFNRRVRRINDREEAKQRLMAEIAAAQRPTAEDGEPAPETEAAEIDRGRSENPDDARS